MRGLGAHSIDILEYCIKGLLIMHRRRHIGLWLIGLVFFSLHVITPRTAVAQGVPYLKEHYTKYEYRITMRDGARLFTSVYIPKDTTRRYPIMLSRTPYSVAPYGPDAYKAKLGPSELFAREGYIVVYQDVRGRMMSEGEFVNMRPHRVKKSSPSDIDESSDTYDTIDWLIKNIPGNNGKVGMWGISYPGFYTAAGMIDAHPALAAASPQAPVTDWFVGDDWHHNGAFLAPHAFNFLSGFGHPRPEPTKKGGPSFDYGTPDGYAFFLGLGALANANRLYFKDDVAFWNEIMDHSTYDDFWKARNIRQHLKNVKPAVMSVGGWFDAENLFGALETYKNVEAMSPSTKNVLVMGPWNHGGWGSEGSSLGPIPFNSKTGEFFREKIEFPFFQSILKGITTTPIPEAWVFETGTNEWRQFQTWPPRLSRKKSIFLRAGGSLAFDPPAKDAASAFDEYVSDPAKPVEYLEKPEPKMAGDYMIQDQRMASRRPDVLVYQGPEIAQDFTVTGSIDVRFFVSTSGTDSDWIVKLIDVYPGDFPTPETHPPGVMYGGYQQLVRGDVMRGKFRESLSDPKPFTPNRITEVNFTMPDVQHCFRTGHKIMIQVQSTWFPLIDRNPQTFVDIYKAKDSDFQKATQRVYHSAEMPSRLEVRELVR
jgi:putative CocE/NonD family hydrolase